MRVIRGKFEDISVKEKADEREFGTTLPLRGDPVNLALTMRHERNFLTAEYNFFVKIFLIREQK